MGNFSEDGLKAEVDKINPLETGIQMNFKKRFHEKLANLLKESHISKLKEVDTNLGGEEGT